MPMTIFILCILSISIYCEEDEYRLFLCVCVLKFSRYCIIRHLAAEGLTIHFEIQLIFVFRREKNKRLKKVDHGKHDIV